MTAFGGGALEATSQATNGRFWILQQNTDEEDESDAGDSSAPIEDLHGSAGCNSTGSRYFTDEVLPSVQPRDLPLESSA
jgi:hypothetical protein